MRRLYTIPVQHKNYGYFNKELRQVFIAITRVWCRKSFPSLFEMTIVIVVLIKIETKIEYNKIKSTISYFELCLTV